MTTYREQLEVIDTITLSGNSQRGDCPFCGGANSFSIRRDFDKLFWKCFRASCSASGVKDVKVSNSELRSRIEHKKGDKKGQLCDSIKQTLPLPKIRIPALKQRLCRNYLTSIGLSDYKDAYYAPKDHRIIFYYEDAAIGRSLGHGPKWKKYGNINTVWDYFTDSNCLYIVEDVPSALRLYRLGFHAIALCGTSLTRNINTKINCNYFQKTAYVALDNDATNRAIYISKQLGGRVLHTTSDFKDLSDEEIKERLKP